MRTLYLYVLNTLADWELGYVLAELHSGRYLKDPGLRYNVILCGVDLTPIRTMGGLSLTPDALLEDISPSAGDLLVLPGGDTWLDPVQAPALETVRRLLNGDVVVAAICGATLGLANAGILDNRPHTSNDINVLRMFCPSYHGERYYVDAPAVTDRNLITASGLAPIDFAHHVFRRLGVMNDGTLGAWYNLSTTRKPEYFYSLMESLPRHS
ncbi:MAG TPA: type 1 glutamine amidotransferase family protein [Methanoregulaceae archaeon]|nr:type 1 glutamine amidotransferase family protein [Methanoregulaceae archaeon]HPD75021.1 type 1 glutamine amidotransferase family protein [Methanoregulaceae archaeon]HRY76060.1 type 1 glutamine amidotransferase family protein [Methanoregulaceae archaeon]